MISNENRFHGRTSLSYVYKNGRSVKSAGFRIKFVKPGLQKNFRVAVVVSKKVSKSAVIRNRIRRNFYEAIQRLNTKQFASADLIISIFEDKLATIEPRELDKIIKKIFTDNELIV